MSHRLFGEKCGSAVWIFLIAAFSILCTGQAYAQVAGATLTGTVKDSSGGVIPNAQVAITDVATAVTRTVSSGGAGLYTAPNLLPGTYEIRVTAMGFSTELQKGITLTVGAQQELDFTMQVGQITQTVEISTEAPTVELTSSELSATVNATTVRELPLNGRSWTDLTNLQPGVYKAEGHLRNADDNRGIGDQSVISGARPQQNNYRLDGISINDYANGGPGSLLGGNLGVEAIQEFSVLTSNYSAEYGKTSGGVVNAITRSGTNQFHGAVYEFLRNSALDADNFFDNATGRPKPPFRRNQFGAAAGGPIRKDRTFIFGDYEGIRQSLGTTFSPVVLSSDARKGLLNFEDPNDDPTMKPTFPTGCVDNGVSHTISGKPYSQCALPVDPSVAKYLGIEPSPPPQTPFGDGNKALAPFAGQDVVPENYFTIRVDQKISEKDNLSGTYNFDKSLESTPDLLGETENHNIAKRQFIALEESHIFGPGLVNTARVGFNRARVGGVANTAINPLTADTSLGWVSGRTAPQVFAGTLTQIGNGVSPTSYRNWNSYQAYDDAFLTRGLHTLKFGFGFERDQLNELDLTADYHGIFTFGSLSTFLTNKPSRFTGGLPGPPGQRGMRQSIVGAYVQDDWRVRPNLTLNLGVRYEMSTVPVEAHGNLTNLYQVTDGQPTCAKLFTSLTLVSCGATGPYFQNPTLRNFEPRIGFSWDPFKNGKTALRGGFGMFDVLPMLYTTITMVGRGAPFTEIGATSNAPKLIGKFPGGVDPNKDLGPHNLEFEHVEQKPPRNYVMQWNLNLQRELAPNLTMVVGFAGSHGVHQALRVDDANIVFPVAHPSAGYLFPKLDVLGNVFTAQCNTLDPNGSDPPPPTCAPAAQINPNITGAIRSLFWAGDSFYSALEVGVVKKMSHGLQVQGSFTWGKSIDNNSGATNGDTLSNAFSSIHWFDLRTSRAVSDYNIPRVLVINANWQVPTSKSASRPVAFVANGWELGAILKVNDGYPFSPTFGSSGDPLGLNSSDPWAFPNRLRTPDCASLINPRNIQNYLKTQCFAVPTAPDKAFWDANCDPAPPGLGYGFDPLNPSNPVAANYGNPPPSWLPPLACFNLAGTSGGRNVVYGPGLTNLDFSLFKNNSFKRISETFNAQFRMEVFNILNHANFAPPTVSKLDVFDPTGSPTGTAGILSLTTTDSRQIQFALKFTW
jgi:outer membrane receptor protein involved in Fe transport